MSSRLFVIFWFRNMIERWKQKNPYIIILVLEYSNLVNTVLHITLKIHQLYHTWPDPLLDIFCKYWIHFTVISTLLSSDLVLLSLFDLSMFFVGSTFNNLDLLNYCNSPVFMILGDAYLKVASYQISAPIMDIIRIMVFIIIHLHIVQRIEVPFVVWYHTVKKQYIHLINDIHPRFCAKFSELVITRS